MASSWNTNLANKLSRAIKTAKPKSGRTYLDVPELAMNELFKASAALADQFFPYADAMLLLYMGEETYFTTRLDSDELAHITRHPEEYVCITVCPR